MKQKNCIFINILLSICEQTGEISDINPNQSDNATKMIEKHNKKHISELERELLIRIDMKKRLLSEVFINILQEEINMNLCLYLSKCKLSILPEKIPIANTLEYINMSYNLLLSIPEFIKDFTYLKILKLSHNSIINNDRYKNNEIIQ